MVPISLESNHVIANSARLLKVALARCQRENITPASWKGQPHHGAAGYVPPQRMRTAIHEEGEWDSEFQGERPIIESEITRHEVWAGWGRIGFDRNLNMIDHLRSSVGAEEIHRDRVSVRHHPRGRVAGQRKELQRPVSSEVTRRLWGDGQ